MGSAWILDIGFCICYGYQNSLDLNLMAPTYRNTMGFLAELIVESAIQDDIWEFDHFDNSVGSLRT